MAVRIGPRLSIEADVEDDVARVVVTGELDLATSEQLDRTLHQVEREATATLVIDLRGVTELDTSGLRVLINADQRARRRGRRVVVRGDYLLRLRVALGDLQERYGPPDAR